MKGTCAVEYRQGQTVESTILPCEVTDKNIKLGLVQATCREHNNELTCEYLYCHRWSVTVMVLTHAIIFKRTAGLAGLCYLWYEWESVVEKDKTLQHVTGGLGWWMT